MLNDSAVKAAKPYPPGWTDSRDRDCPEGAPRKYADGRGLFLLVQPNGTKIWRFRYTFGGREKLISFGTYPDVKLKRAREKRADALNQLDRNIDPSAARQEAKRAARVVAFGDAETFEYVALEFLLTRAGRSPPETTDKKPVPLAQLKAALDRQLETLAAKDRAGASRANTLKTTRRRLERFVFPYLGERPMGTAGTEGVKPITGPELLSVIRRIEARVNPKTDRPTHETAHRTLTACGRVFRYAVSTGRAEFDAAASIDRGVLVPVESKNFAAIVEPKKIGELLRAIDGYQGQPAAMAALKLAPLVFVRPGELRAAEWVEFDFDATIEVGKKTRPAPLWRIPGERMKMGAAHLVPLATQAVAILEELRPLTGHGRFLFPSLRSGERPISENTLNAGLRRLGFAKDEQSAHGFRRMASTRLNELGFDRDAIERQLAHAERDRIRAAYNAAEYLPERRTMMQAWADYLDGLKVGGANVRAIRA